MKVILISCLTLVLFISSLYAENDTKHFSCSDRSDVDKKCKAYEFKFGYFKDYELADKVAKRSKKPVVLFALDDSPASNTFRKESLSNEKIVEILKKDFIVLILDIDRVPRKYHLSQSPATWFIKDNEPMFQALVGYNQPLLKTFKIITEEF